ncbi:hypothetical protein HAX54_013583 [Datura stramonium]|uniref:Uncharacterized protein n=1 Tax=Datura stramonium TaxID=4076 RepID=A0ABS8RYF2_DATST|nr:hypothetical protein [Datura stramonium]
MIMIQSDDDYRLDIYHTSKLVMERYEGRYRKDKTLCLRLFVSPNSTWQQVVDAKQTACIYFTVDALHALYTKSLTHYRQTGIYCMEEGRIKRPFPNPPLWFQPRLAIRKL